MLHKLQLSAPKQKQFYASKKRDTLKSQLVVDKRKKNIICTLSAQLSLTVDVMIRLGKESKTYVNPKIRAVTDAGYQGINPH
jgi:hypothetical protein